MIRHHRPILTVPLVFYAIPTSYSHHFHLVNILARTLSVL